ncbi:glycosyltransferase family 4 protein [Solimonas flava]|uniref:glycosyltransferase family 4 protein n=1 Tax=Solimonas flava TaxID=415849 RepID=UPI0003FF6990|nr:glycosyltransferase family 4 protein [Solimonas flava]
MRIIMVEHSHLLGGVERHVLDLMLALRANGHAVCYAGPLDGWLGEQCQRHDLSTLALPMRGMFDVLSALRLARFARRWQADLLHGHTQRGTRYATWAGHWAGIPALATAHSTHAYRRFERAARTICVSDAVRASLLANGLPAARLTRIHSGIADPAPLAPPRRRAATRAACSASATTRWCSA